MAVLSKLVQERLSRNKKVKGQGFGSFAPVVEGDPEGASTAEI